MTAKSFSEYISAYNLIKNETNASGKPLRIAVLRSFSCEALERPITVDAFESGYLCEFFFGGYKQYPQEILNSESLLYKFKPDIILFAVNMEDICPQVFDMHRLAEPSDADAVTDAVDEFVKLISILRKNISSVIIINNFIKPKLLTKTYYDSTQTFGFGNLVRVSNQNLLKSIQNMESTFIFDVEGLSCRFGEDNIYDLKQWQIAKNPYNIRFYIVLSQAYVGMINAIFGKRKKCIVVDLDNTLWNGIIGEDGISGIDINESFRDFQKQLKFWQQSGILLAVNSKNNYDDALMVFEKHPDMFLKKDDFSAFEINWNDKASNLINIAKKLNIGLDSMIFIDDSEFECRYVEKECPEISVIQLDGNYINYADIAKNLPLLDFITLSQEDKMRTELYHVQSKRLDLMRSSESVLNYLELLETKLSINPINELTIARAAQLTQKTNQFNLTTKRYTVDDLNQMREKDFQIFTVGARDKFGDNGISGLIIIDTSSDEKKEWLIDNILLSCRVMGRNIEHAMWAFIISKAHTCDIKIIKGEYIPTSKNKPIEGLLPSLGFVEINGYWQYDTLKDYICPHYITIN